MTLFPSTIAYKTRTVTYTNGRPGFSETTGSFIGSVQPMTDREIETLQIGRKDVGKVKIYSSSLLNVSQEGSTYSGDIVEWQGKDWEIIQGNTNQNGLINHYKYIGEYRK